MGLFSKLFGNPHPSAQWSAAPGLTIVLDLSTPALSGLRLGDSASRIAQFGPPSRVDQGQNGHESYTYAQHGFAIGVADQSVESWNVFFDPAAAGVKSAPFTSQVTCHGQPVRLDGTIDVDDFRRRFGEPYWTDVDDWEILLFYELGPIEWQVEFRRQRLSVLNLVTPPLMSDAEQRAHYAVDKPWPPPT